MIGVSVSRAIPYPPYCTLYPRLWDEIAPLPPVARAERERALCEYLEERKREDERSCRRVREGCVSDEEQQEEEKVDISEWLMGGNGTHS